MLIAGIAELFLTIASRRRSGTTSGQP